MRRLDEESGQSDFFRLILFRQLTVYVWLCRRVQVRSAHVNDDWAVVILWIMGPRSSGCTCLLRRPPNWRTRNNHVVHGSPAQRGRQET